MSACITATMLSINGRGVKYCPAPDFFLVGVFLQNPFVEIAQALLPRAVPVELIDLGHKY